MPLTARRSLMAAIAAALTCGSLAFAAGPASARAVPTTTVDHWGTFLGQHRPGGHRTSLVPIPMTVPGRVVEIGTSNSTDYALLANGKLYAWGQGSHGQLGDGHLADSFGRPVQGRFPHGVKIKSIPADVMPFDSCLAIDTTRHVWGWGFNDFGELGDGNTQTSYVPVRVRNLDGADVASLVASYGNTGVLMKNGSYYDWGLDSRGQLGDGLVGHGADTPVAVSVPGRVALVSLGGSLGNNGQTLVQLADGKLFAWGEDRYGQLGNGATGHFSSPVPFSPPHGVTYWSLATSGATSYAISMSGNVYAWGASAQGQAGNGGRTPVLTPVKVVPGGSGLST